MIEQLTTIFLGASRRVDLVIPLPSFYEPNYSSEILRETLPLIDQRIPTRYLFTTDMSQIGELGPGGLAATVDTFFNINDVSNIKFQQYNAKFALGIVDDKIFIIDEPQKNQPRISFAKTKEEFLSFRNFFENLWN